uniref:Diphthamide biosynthesis protein 3 n=1 Tax=Sarcophilus harrisii TaxID=9305 RepID=A0A7N4PPZ7_SARHA
MSVFHDEVEIEDFEYEEETETYLYPCPCGDNFVITKEDLENGEEVATCPSCSLVIKVIYDRVSALPPGAGAGGWGKAPFPESRRPDTGGSVLRLPGQVWALPGLLSHLAGGGGGGGGGVWGGGGGGGKSRGLGPPPVGLLDSAPWAEPGPRAAAGSLLSQPVSCWEPNPCMS